VAHDPVGDGDWTARVMPRRVTRSTSVSSTRTLTTFLGWCTVINFSLLILAGLVWMILKDGVAGFGAPMFGVTEAELKVTFMRVLLQ
jgi:hypothetical protein